MNPTLQFMPRRLEFHRYCYCYCCFFGASSSLCPTS